MIPTKTQRSAVVMGVAAVLCAVVTYAAVWNEPWHRDVVIGADSLGLYEPVDVAPFKTVFKRIRPLAGADTGETVTVDGFSGSTVPSTTSTRPGMTYDDEWTLRFRAGRRYYLFLKRAPAGVPALGPSAAPGGASASVEQSWRIATPTEGLAEVRPDGAVVATYRHSLHQAGSTRRHLS